MKKELFEVENYLKRYTHAELFVNPGEEYFELKYCAKITHKGLNISFETESESEDSRKIQIDIKKRQLEKEWELKKLQKIDMLLSDINIISNDLIFDSFKNTIDFNIANPTIDIPFQIEVLKSKIRVIEFKLLDIEKKKEMLNTRIDKSRSYVVKQIIEDEFWKKEELNIKNNQKNTIQLENLRLEKMELENRLKNVLSTNNSEWKKLKSDFEQTQTDKNIRVEELKEKYLNHDYESIVTYENLILENIIDNEYIENEFDLNYNKKNKVLTVNYSLPPIDKLPKLKNIKNINGETREYYISESQQFKNYEKVLYSLTLRNLFILFSTDQINAIESICFNGWVNAINMATGKRMNYCILSIQVLKSEFLELDLEYIEPKICFRALKGISANKLHSTTPIQPFIQINRNDKRFVDSHDITGNIDDSTNLAAMDWEDFEHLIREVFEKEFQSNGGEVKVTQASRDGGVDAIAFDPDPIRGGKIVIQAKRYTNTVGVSAVRDLYGTVMNEGATKGILVTTSDYGSDSYEFAKGKPLTLLNGSNLLYLLEKHGHSAKIDIEEARKLMKN